MAERLVSLEVLIRTLGRAAVENAAAGFVADTDLMIDLDKLLALLGEIDPAAQAAVSWRHLKRGTTYAEVGRGQLQASGGPLGDGSEVVVYRGDDGKLWVRGVVEFEDGRFERLS